MCNVQCAMCNVHIENRLLVLNVEKAPARLRIATLWSQTSIKDKFKKEMLVLRAQSNDNVEQIRLRIIVVTNCN